MGEGPLSGLRVADFSKMIGGPKAGMILADLGADVIKVEGPDQIDLARNSGTQGSMFWMGNRNKRSIAIEMSQPEGLEVAARLVANCDVLIEASRPGVMDKLGLGYEAMRRLNQRLIYATLVGYGSTGPGANRGAFDGSIQAESGMMLATGEEGGPPVKTGPYLVDEAAGATFVQAIMVALYARERTGLGDRVAVSMLDTALYLQTWELAEYSLLGRQAPRTGNALTTTMPGEVYQTKDGAMYVCAMTDVLYQRTCHALGLAGLADDPRFATLADRLEHKDEINEALKAAFLTRTREEWREILESVGVVVGVVRSYGEVISDPQVEANDSFLIVPDQGRRVHFVRPPYSLGGRRFPTGYQPPPVVGQHSRQILSELGYPDSDVQRLVDSGIVAVAPQTG